MAATAAVTAAVVGAASTVYAASQAKSPKMPQTPAAPKLPDTKDTAASMQQADIQARTAGGTILSNPATNKQQAIGDGANTTRKTLLGQ